MKELKKLLIFIGLLALIHLMPTSTQAQAYSYVYIQGDKSVPFYVKLEGQMMPRYGKNYFIIPRLVPGVIELEILFQQNLYPAHQFQIKVPDNGYRSFLLTKRDNGYALFDLVQGFYLESGNDEDEDFLPAQASEYTPLASQEPTATSPAVVKANPSEPKPSKIAGTAKKQFERISKELQPKETENVTVPGEPRFLNDIELYGEHTVPPSAMGNTDGQSGLIPNSDCPLPISEDRMNAIYQKAMSFPEEESRLSYLNSQLNICISTAQAARLATTMQSNAARYSWLKKIYPRITDQAVFPSLKDLFSDDAWKTHFLEMIQ